jgi:hypothetical protein
MSTMATSIPETYRIADLLQWYKEKTLTINEQFQRRNVWTTSAKSYLVDTVLRRLPVPMMFMRTKVDHQTQRAYREVVDGQQRLRTFVDFASNKLRLDKRAGEFEGLSYRDLPPESQQAFLAYPITVTQLINAGDRDVLEVFSRLNAYNVALNEAELRHAKFQNDFKWAVHSAALDLDILWEKYRILTVRQRVRMLDDSLMAEMFGILLQGVRDGGERKITQTIYERYEKEPWDHDVTVKHLREVIEVLDKQLGDAIAGTMARPPHFLMLFAAVAHGLVGIPAGDMGEQMPARDARALSDIDTALVNLSHLESIIGQEGPERDFREFWSASSGTTHRIASRKVRFPVYYRALVPDPF